jgi:hypothetical protein
MSASSGFIAAVEAGPTWPFRSSDPEDLAVGESGVLQFEQARASGAAHSSQNLAWGYWKWQGQTRFGPEDVDEG